VHVSIHSGEVGVNIETHVLVGTEVAAGVELVAHVLGDEGGGIIVDYEGVFGVLAVEVAAGEEGAPFLDAVGGAEDGSAAEEVGAAALEGGAEVAAEGVDKTEVLGFAEPEGAAEGGLVETSAADSTEVDPAAPTEDTLRHSQININKVVV
jgi:hypothetical protein